MKTVITAALAVLMLIGGISTAMGINEQGASAPKGHPVFDRAAYINKAAGDGRYR